MTVIYRQENGKADKVSLFFPPLFVIVYLM